MNTRGTNSSGWFGAFFLLCAIAGGIVVSCKTTEPPVGAQKDEGAATEESVSLPRSSERPVVEEAALGLGQQPQDLVLKLVELVLTQRNLHDLRRRRTGPSAQAITSHHQPSPFAAPIPER